MFEHKEDKSGTTEAEWWGAAPWDRRRVETDRETERQRGITPDRFPIHSVRSAPHRSPRTPPSIPSFRLSIHLIPHSFPVCLSANALQRSRLPCPPEWVSVGLMPVSGAASLRTNLEFRYWMEDRRTFHSSGRAEDAVMPGCRKRWGRVIGGIHMIVLCVWNLGPKIEKWKLSNWKTWSYYY